MKTWWWWWRIWLSAPLQLNIGSEPLQNTCRLTFFSRQEEDLCGHVVPRMSQTEGDTRGQEVKTSSAQCVSCCRGYCGTLEHRWKTNQCYNPAINDQINYAHMFLFFQEQQTKIQNTLYLQNHREVFFILCSVKKRGVKKLYFSFPMLFFQM